MTDLIIIGGGPAGASAALYALRANLSVLLLENGPGALGKAHRIENYYGITAAGPDLYNAGLQQLRELGAQIIHTEALSVDYTGNFAVQTDGALYEAPAVILATGGKSATLRLDGLQQLEGHGVSYCAVCDGFFYRGKKVAVLGSGAYALHEADYLRHLAGSVIVLTNGQSGRAAVKGGFTVDERPLKAVTGTEKITGVTFADGSSLSLDGLFVALGTAGSTDMARKMGAAVDGRYISVDDNCATNIPGLFAAGDCTGGMLQVAKAVYQGAVAGNAAVSYVRSRTN